MIAHAARLRRAAGRVGLGIEVDDHGRAAEVRQLDGAAVLVRQLEVGSGVTLLNHARDASGGIRASRLRGLVGGRRTSISAWERFSEQARARRAERAAAVRPYR